MCIKAEGVESLILWAQRVCWRNGRSALGCLGGVGVLGLRLTEPRWSQGEGTFCGLIGFLQKKSLEHRSFYDEFLFFSLWRILWASPMFSMR